MPGPHHPGIGLPERDVHGDERPERVDQDVHARGTAAASQTPAAQAAADGTIYAVSYVEVMASAVSKAVAALKQYREANRGRDGFVRFDIFEQVGRPGHFALFEAWRDAAAFDARGASQKQLVDALTPIRVSDYDQRPYKAISVGPAPRRRTAAPCPSCPTWTSRRTPAWPAC